MKTRSESVVMDYGCRMKFMTCEGKGNYYLRVRTISTFLELRREMRKMRRI